MLKLLKKSTRQSNSGPEIYENVVEARKQLKNPSNFKRYAREILDLVPKKTGTVLDVGCGLGWLVQEANKRGFDAWGVDSSKTLVRFGKAKLGLNLSNSFPKNKFDIVIAKHVLEHIKPAEPFLKKILNSLAPEGVFIVACPNNKSLMHWIFGSRWYGLCPNQHVWQFTPKILSVLLEVNGFNIDKIIINSLDYKPGGIKQGAFWFLTNLANILRIGDQVIIICSRR